MILSIFLLPSNDLNNLSIITWATRFLNGLPSLAPSSFVHREETCCTGIAKSTIDGGMEIGIRSPLQLLKIGMTIKFDKYSIVKILTRYQYKIIIIMWKNIYI